MYKPCLPVPRHQKQNRWRPAPATPRRPSPPLRLLPSGPDRVHGLLSRGDQCKSPLTDRFEDLDTRSSILQKHKRPFHKAFYVFDWRRRRDSNPRYAINVYTLSRRAPSTARTLLRMKIPLPLPSEKSLDSWFFRGARLNHQTD